MKKYLPTLGWISIFILGAYYVLGFLNKPIAQAQKYIADYQQTQAMRAVGKCVNNIWKGPSTVIGGAYASDKDRLAMLIFYDIHDDRHGFYTLVARCALDSRLDWSELVIVDHLVRAYFTIDDRKEHTILFVYDMVYFLSREATSDFIETTSAQEALGLFDGVRAAHIPAIGQPQNPDYVWKDMWKLLERKVSQSAR